MGGYGLCARLERLPRVARCGLSFETVHGGLAFRFACKEDPQLLSLFRTSKIANTSSGLVLHPILRFSIR
jgi:hypothetical protein